MAPATTQQERRSPSNTNELSEYGRYLFWSTRVEQVPAGRPHSWCRRSTSLQVTKALCIQQGGDGAGVEQALILTILAWKRQSSKYPPMVLTEGVRFDLFQEPTEILF